MEHRALFSSVSLWVHQQESGLQILLFIFFLSYRATQGLNRHPPHPPNRSSAAAFLSVRVTPKAKWFITGGMWAYAVWLKPTSRREEIRGILGRHRNET